MLLILDMTAAVLFTLGGFGVSALIIVLKRDYDSYCKQLENRTAKFLARYGHPSAPTQTLADIDSDLNNWHYSLCAADEQFRALERRARHDHHQ